MAGRAWKLIALMGAALLGVPQASAQGTVTLKVAHIFPAGHYLWEQGGKPFADAVTAATNGKVKFEVYPAGQLGKDYVALLQSGLADISIISPSYSPEKFLMSSVAELPGLYGKACEGTAKLWSMAKSGATLDKAEYKKLGLHLLFVTVLPPYQVMTTTKEVKTLEDLSGLKLRANGAAMDKTIRSLGAVPIRVPSPELYETLMRGTVDGGLYPYQGLPGYKLEKLLRHSVSGSQLGAGAVLYAMSEKGWNGLPADIRDAMANAARSTQKQLCQWQDEEEGRVLKKIIAEDEHVAVTLSAGESARWQERLNSVLVDWAKEMDAAGRNGTALLKEFREASGRDD